MCVPPLGFTRARKLANKKDLQYAMNIVRICRKTGTETPFLSRVLNGVDESLGRSLTDSELAEECMGGM